MNKAIATRTDETTAYCKTPRHGKYTIICPFHAEKTPSAIVDTANGMFWCLSCGAIGDLEEVSQDEYNIVTVKQ